MRIERITLTHVCVPLHGEFRISSGAIASTHAIVVRLEGDGVVGYGQSSPMASGIRYSPETPDSCWAALTESLVPLVLNKDIASPAGMNGILDAVPEQPFARAGIETAFWDLLAKADGVPLYHLLGGQRNVVECGLVAGLRPSTVDLLRWVECYLPRGYRRLKVKIKHGHDLNVVCVLRKAYPDLPLQVDANTDYGPSDLQHLARLDEYGLAMIEQPFAPDALDDHARLQQSVKTPICLDESLADVAACEDAIGRGSLRVANIKVQRVGGLLNACAMHDACARSGIAAWVGCMPELGIGLAHSLALATLPGMTFPTDVQPVGPYFVDDIINPGIEMSSDGTLTIPDRPGIGFEVDDSKLAAYRVRATVFA